MKGDNLNGDTFIDRGVGVILKQKISTMHYPDNVYDVYWTKLKLIGVSFIEDALETLS